MQASQILIYSPQDFLHHVQTNHVDKDRFGNRGLLTQRRERFFHHLKYQKYMNHRQNLSKDQEMGVAFLTVVGATLVVK